VPVDFGVCRWLYWQTHVVQISSGRHLLMSDVTRILSAIDQGDPSAAAAELLPLVYKELRNLATVRLAREKPGQTLQATALVHEAYLRLVAGHDQKHWNGRGHFFAAAAEAMRRILVDMARRKRGPKRGGDRRRVTLDEVCSLADDRSDQLLALNEALQKLEAESPDKAELVKLRYFAGLPHQEAAEALGISRATADRYWAYAKVFLYAELEDSEES
jgi:RNA polymerase sigma factor (TIGR02999 family)